MNYKEIIESKYNREAWQQLLHDIFLSNVSFWRSPKEVKANSRLAKNALNLGKISLSDGEALAIYEVELSDKVDIERNRAGIRDMLTKDWRDMGYAGAFLFCYRKNESVLRFSYVSETWGFNKDGIYERLSTNTKRYTYLLGEGRGCRTAIEQFGALKNSKLALSDVTAAFSVEALTKQFYKDLYEWYQWAVDPASGVYFPNNTSIEADDREDIETKIIRLITRIMFVWFIKQKELVPNKIFDVDFLETILKDFDPNSAVVGNYYNAILQNLFFGTLNRAIEDEQGNKRKFATNVKKDIKTLYRYAEMFTISEDEVIKLFSEVPFLNGGLFECLDKTKTIDGVEQAYNYDGFSRNDKKFADGRYRNRAVVPNVLFFEPERGLISILSRYNFTIEENSPEEQQVALDPELLGKVFENLLGAYNPETKETARNQSGSFYTPREIVNYMVDESLISYLGNTAFVRSLFSPEFVYDKTKEAEYKTMISAETQNKEYMSRPIAQPEFSQDKYFSENNEIVQEQMNSLISELTQEDKKVLAMKWGVLYRPEEWIELEKDYNNMMNSFDIQDADTINTLILICKTNLKMNQALDAGDIEGYQKLSKVSESLRKSAKFTAAQNKEQKNDYVTHTYLVYEKNNKYYYKFNK